MDGGGVRARIPVRAQIRGPRAGFAAGLLYAVYPGALILAGVLTNQHISLFFCLLGMWLIVERGPFAGGRHAHEPGALWRGGGA